MAFFEASIYNEEVRALVKDYNHHEFLDDVWAELNFIEVEARDEEDAMKKLQRKYPEKNGYKITQLVSLG